MKIKNFLHENKIGISKASKELGFPYLTIKRWVDGSRLPRPENMKKIIEWSHGAVQPSDFYEAKD